MKLAFSGSREITNRAIIQEIIANIPGKEHITEIVHGGARGVDRIAADICEGIWPVKVFPADWRTHGPKAGPIRNAEMAAYADVLVAIMIEGGSRGTQNMIDRMIKLGKPVATYTVPRSKAKG